MFENVSIILCFIVAVVYLEPLVKNANNYGPYVLRFDSYNDCKGPKSKNVTKMQSSMDPKTYTGYINLTFLEDATFDEMKVQVHSLKDNKKVFLWSYKLKDLCKHFAFAIVIEQYLNATNCVIKKGNYNIQLSYGQIVHSFLGNSFFYGTYYFKADLTSKKGNIGCFISTNTFLKP